MNAIRLRIAPKGFIHLWLQFLPYHRARGCGEATMSPWANNLSFVPIFGNFFVSFFVQEKKKRKWG